jgi:hypothetical protein
MAMLAWLALVPCDASSAEAQPRYLWLNSAPASLDSLAARIPPPSGFERRPVPQGSFAEWLRNLPLRPPQTPIRLYDGRLKPSQDLHVAIVDIDTGDRDLQQCADAIMRLRAEYLFAAGRVRDIAFNDSDGKRMTYGGPSADRKAFRRYLLRVFSYAGTYSLARELQPASLADIVIGDVFIKGGFPGHAVLVADMAVAPASGEKRFLLLQSFMPAQDMHILKNPRDAGGSPWYAPPAPEEDLVTPEWVFKPGSLRRFRD